MKEKRILYVIGQADERYIEEAAPGAGGSATTTVPRLRQRVSVVLAAALLALLLMGAGVVAVIYGDSIQNWFAYYWERLTGQTMTEEHTTVIDHLSQRIGVGQTIGDATVTVDSVTVGDDILYLLLRVEGLSLSKRHSYYFGGYDMVVSPDPLEGAAGMGAMGLRFHGLDGDGAALFLMEFEYASQNGFEKDTRPLEATVALEDFVRTQSAGKQKVLAEGEWELSFSIDRSRLPDPIALPDTMVTGYSHHEDALVTALHTGIELTNTGIRFRCDEEAYIDYDMLMDAPPHVPEESGLLVAQLHAILENGQIVEMSGGMGVPLKDSGLWEHTYHWQIPLNLEEVAAIQIGSTKITVP